MRETIIQPNDGLMWAARLHGPADLRFERVPLPPPPRNDEVRIRIRTTGICGSDLHSYADARIGDTVVTSPLILGHEFSGEIELAGDCARDGFHQPLRVGARVAVDPSQPCHRCPECEQGHPNLCANLQFCGNHPCNGSLCERISFPGRCCFPVPDSLSDTEAALLEPLGVAIHAVDLAKIRVAQSVAIVGAGPVGLLILQMARLAGAAPVFITDPLPWRLRLAERYGGIALEGQDFIAHLRRETRGVGVDVAVEAAWGDRSVEQAAEIVRLGGRLVLVGIPSDDRLAMKHSTARRKGLTILMSRRMAHTYPRAIRLADERRVDLSGLVSHRFPLARAAAAFQLNVAYGDNVVKVMVDG